MDGEVRRHREHDDGRASVVACRTPLKAAEVRDRCQSFTSLCFRSYLQL